MIVISHLALNEMLKLGNEIIDICLLLECRDDKIKDLVKQFLSELKNKGNNIVFNLIPKALNGWLTDKKHFPYSKFKTVMNELISNIEKDKQIEGLIEKLLNKLRSTNDIKDWQCVTYCLALLNYSEKNSFKLFEYFSTIRDLVMDDEEILKNLKLIFEKIKKSVTDKENISEIENFILNGDNNKLAKSLKEKKELAKVKKIGKKRNLDDLENNNKKLSEYFEVSSNTIESNKSSNKNNSNSVEYNSVSSKQFKSKINKKKVKSNINYNSNDKFECIKEENYSEKK